MANIKRSISIAGHRTSITLEPEFWESLKSIAAVQKRSLSQLLAEIDAGQPENLSSALRVYVLNFYKKKIL